MNTRNQPREVGSVTDKQTEPERRSWGKILVFTVLAIVTAVAIVFGVMQLTGGDNTLTGSQDETSEPTAPEPTAPEPTATDEEGDDDMDTIRTGPVLPEPLNGQEAIDALGDDIEFVANRNGRTVEELEELLLNNNSAYVSTNGFVFFRDNPLED